jgi:hypothetical protein
MDDVERHHAQRVVLLYRPAGTVLVENALSHLKQKTVLAIDLVLIGPQSVGKRSLDLMDTINAK